MKRIGILGTGQVANTISNALIQLGYEVKMSSRTANNEKATGWAKSNGRMASNGTFTDAALFGQIIFNCTKGEHTLDVFNMAGISNFNNKIIIDVSNPLDFSKGMPPTLIPSLANTNSLGEEIQKLLPDAKVVKTLNIVNCEVMVRASKCGGQATMFLAGNDSDAKKEVSNLLNQFGWDDLIDLGSIVHARSTEMMFPIWLSIYMATQNGYLAFKVIR
jgi:8-hydroxy-5-deazaflavin:NADPH oxidoreductase